MGFLFGSEKNKDKKNRRNDELSEKDKAALQVKRHRDRLKKYEKEMQKKIDRETEICKELLKQKKRDKAKLALRKKKYQTNLLEKARNQLLNIEELIENVEAAEMQKEVFKAIQSGTQLLEEINSEMSLEEVENLMDDTAEAIAYQQELNAILSENLTQIDDDDVLKELAQIEQMEADEVAMNMANVPNKAIAIQQQQEAQQEPQTNEKKKKKTKKQVLVQ